MQTLGLYLDINPGMPNAQVPREFNNNKQIKGVYMFVRDTLRTTNWEEVAKSFCKERLGTSLEGKGSTRAACRLIQQHWGEFVNWSKTRYHS